LTFLDGPAEVLTASLACRRWRVLATADVVWRGKFEREGLREKAARFELLVPCEPGRATLTAYEQIFALRAHKFTTNEELKAGADLWHEDREAAFAKYGPMSDWDVSDITDMSELFGGEDNAAKGWKQLRKRPHFNEDLSRWNVSSVTNMYCMFADARAFNASIGGWDVSSVTNMAGMFDVATAFTGTGICCWDVSSVTNMYCMFADTKFFNAPIGDWDVSSVTTMQSMLYGAIRFNHQLGGQWVTSTADKVFMFHGCHGSIEGNPTHPDGTPKRRWGEARKEDW